MSRVLIVVDVQNDFCEGGSLGVAGGTEVAGGVTELIETEGHRWDHIVATRDWHIDPGSHFSAEPDFRDSWPPHCVVGTHGAQFHPAFDHTRVEAVFDKGAYEAAYSGFEGSSGETGLAQWLREHDADTVDLVGIATDHCVRATALDAVREGLTATVLLDYTAAVAEETKTKALAELKEAGVALR